MRYELRILPAADADVDEIALYLSGSSLSAALRFHDSVDQSYRQIRENPRRSPLYSLDHPRLIGLRRCFVSGFRKYLIFYRIKDDLVEIIRVLHGARDVPSVLVEEPGEQS